MTKKRCIRRTPSGEIDEHSESSWDSSSQQSHLKMDWVHRQDSTIAPKIFFASTRNIYHGGDAVSPPSAIAHDAFRGRESASPHHAQIRDARTACIVTAHDVEISTPFSTWTISLAKLASFDQA